MSNPAFLVDGQMEKRIIQSICPGHRVWLLDCNGKDVTYEAAGKRAATLIRLLKNSYPIIVIFDREKRQDGPEVVAEKLHDAIICQGIQEVDIIIGVPNTMAENWMLADIQSVNAHYSIQPPLEQGSFEGDNGKGKLRSLISHNRKYAETQDGPEIFKGCRVATIYENSSSFKSFFDKLKPLRCTWLSSG